VATIRTVVPVVAHYKVIRFLNDFWTVVFVAAKFWRHIQIWLENLVNVHFSVFDPNGVSLLGDDPFDERFIGVTGIVKHYDVPRLRLSEESIHRLVDDQAILIL